MKLIPTYRKSPNLFIEEIIGDSLWSVQKDICNSIVTHKRTAVRSCHGSGKSFLSARIALWFLSTYPGSKVITTAPTFRQVKDILWREIRRAYNQANRFNKRLDGVLTDTKLDVKDDWFAMGLSTDDPDRFQGFHAVNILLIVDEASGIKEDIYTASEGIISSENARALYIGNPTNLAGTFYQSFKQDNYARFSISAFDTPNFTSFGITIQDIRNNTWQDKITGKLPRPYLITPEWVYDKLKRWGEGTPMWDSRVLGNFPTQGEDTLIPLHKIEEATRRQYKIKPEDPEAIGADIARFGTDKTIFVHRKGQAVTEIKEYAQLDTMQTSSQLHVFWGQHPQASVGIDVVGIGAGVVDRMKQLNPMKQVDAINVGESPNDPERFMNLRAEIYWGLRQRFIDDTIVIPNDDDLVAQLANIKYEFTPKGQIKLESKEDMKSRGMSSPDKADALAMAFMNKKEKPSLIQFYQGKM